MGERVGKRLVHCTIERAVATITLDSPSNRNALSRQLLDELHAALDETEQPGVRVVVLSHTPPVFCAGADLKERNDKARNDKARNGKERGDAAGTNISTSGASMVRAIERLSGGQVPTIAAVNGPVRAGGIGIMAACDLVVVASTVTFAFTEVRLGVAPAIISVPILARCGWSKLAAPFLTGEVFDASFAHDIGLITHTTDDVAATVATLVAGILAGAPNAIAATRRVLRSGSPDMAEMQALSEALFNSPEAAEGMRAFAAKTTPAWVN